MTPPVLPSIPSLPSLPSLGDVGSGIASAVGTVVGATAGVPFSLAGISGTRLVAIGLGILLIGIAAVALILHNGDVRETIKTGVKTAALAAA